MKHSINSPLERQEVHPNSGNIEQQSPVSEPLGSNEASIPLPSDAIEPPSAPVAESKGEVPATPPTGTNVKKPLWKKVARWLKRTVGELLLLLFVGELAPLFHHLLLVLFFLVYYRMMGHQPDITVAPAGGKIDPRTLLALIAL